MTTEIERIALSTGMMVALKSSASKHLGSIPARIIQVWPRFQSGEYLVTLEYAQPVKLNNAWVTHIDAFACDLYQPTVQQQPEGAAARSRAC